MLSQLCSALSGGGRRKELEQDVLAVCCGGCFQTNLTKFPVSIAGNECQTRKIALSCRRVYEYSLVWDEEVFETSPGRGPPGRDKLASAM
ncbi:hypothetical protein EK904_006140 [Melospiza melodia maxima]|nr:hypothetical protein EK904_006140 [Melospiza melodia maxima]